MSLGAINAAFGFAMEKLRQICLTKVFALWRETSLSKLCCTTAENEIELDTYIYTYIYINIDYIFYFYFNT